jgi:hypothetical protein
MPKIFQGPNILEILRLGLAGLCFLLSLLAFWLIYNEQRREGGPRRGVLRTIYAFIALNLVAALLVGAGGYLGPRSESGKADDLNAKTYLVDHTWYLVDLTKWVEPVGPVDITRTDFIHKVSSTADDYVVPYFTSGTRIDANFKNYSRVPKFEPTTVEGSSGAHYLYKVPLGDRPAGTSETVSTIFTFPNGFKGEGATWWEASVQYPSRTVSVEIQFSPLKPCKSIQVFAIPGIGEKKPLTDNEPVLSNGGKMAMWVGENIDPSSRIHFAWDW